MNEGDRIIVGRDYTVLPREGCSKQALSNNELLELIVSVDVETAIDLDEIDKLFAQPPTISSSEFHHMMNALPDYCQWQDCVIAANLNMTPMQAQVFDSNIPKMEQDSLGLPVLF